MSIILGPTFTGLQETPHYNGIQYDNSGSGLPVTVTPGQNMLVARTVGPTEQPASMSFAGIFFTKQFSQDDGNQSGMSYWDLQNPPTGTFPLCLTGSHDFTRQVCVNGLTNVDPVTPRGIGVAIGSYTSSTTVSTQVSTSVGDLVLDVIEVAPSSPSGAITNSGSGQIAQVFNALNDYSTSNTQSMGASSLVANSSITTFRWVMPVAGVYTRAAMNYHAAVLPTVQVPIQTFGSVNTNYPSACVATASITAGSKLLIAIMTSDASVTSSISDGVNTYSIVSPDLVSGGAHTQIDNNANWANMTVYETTNVVAGGNLTFTGSPTASRAILGIEIPGSVPGALTVGNAVVTDVPTTTATSSATQVRTQANSIGISFLCTPTAQGAVVLPSPGLGFTTGSLINTIQDSLAVEYQIFTYTGSDAGIWSPYPAGATWRMGTVMLVVNAATGSTGASQNIFIRGIEFDYYDASGNKQAIIGGVSTAYTLTPGMLQLNGPNLYYGDVSGTCRLIAGTLQGGSAQVNGFLCVSGSNLRWANNGSEYIASNYFLAT